MVAAEGNVADVNDATTPTLIGRKSGIESHPRTTRGIVGIVRRRVHATARLSKITSGDGITIAGYSGHPREGGVKRGSAVTSRQRRMSILIGIVGAIGSCLALVGFLLKIRRNGLEFPDGATTQAFYQSVGTAYTWGFVAGFSLCFFLTLLAVAVGTWFENRRKATALHTESVRIPLVGPSPRE